MYHLSAFWNSHFSHSFQWVTLATLSCFTSLYSCTSFGHSATMCSTVSSTTPPNWDNGDASPPHTFFCHCSWVMLDLVAQKCRYLFPFSGFPFSINPMTFLPITLSIAFFNCQSNVFSWYSASSLVLISSLLLPHLLYPRTWFLETSASMFCLSICRYFHAAVYFFYTQFSTPIKALSISVLLKCNLSTSAFGSCIPDTVNSLLVFLSNRSNSAFVPPIIPAPYVITGTVFELIAAIMFPPMSLDLNTYLLHLAYTSLDFSLIFSGLTHYFVQDGFI